MTLKQSNGSLKISLKDSKGSPISGVSILVDGVQKGSSDNSGTIVISELSPKEYQVVASSTLYGKVTQIVKVEGETEKEINLVLESNIFNSSFTYYNNCYIFHYNLIIKEECETYWTSKDYI